MFMGNFMSYHVTPELLLMENVTSKHVTSELLSIAKRHGYNNKIETKDDIIELLKIYPSLITSIKDPTENMIIIYAKWKYSDINECCV